MKRFDWPLFLSACALATLGLILIYGITLSQEQTTFIRFYKQLTAFGLGLGAIITCLWLDYRHFRSLGFIAYLAGFVLLLIVLFLGKTVNGTVGWFQLGPFSFQPVEFAKIFLVLYLAAFFSRRARGQLSWKMFFQSGIATAMYIGLIMLQPDFGSAMVLLGTWLFLCLFVGLPRYAWAILPTATLLTGILAWNVALKPYQKARIENFIHQTADVRDSGYNAAQARIAIGSGGWIGRGLGSGSQARLRFLPEASTDFIFSVLGEELGFVGVCLTLGLYSLLLQRFITLAKTSDDDFAALFLLGVASVLFIHVFVNIGMNLGVLPITGIPLPLISAAASSFLSIFLAIGIAESIAARRKSFL